MKSIQTLVIRLEVIWWLLTFLILGGVLFPIYTKVGNNYPFYLINSVFIITFITITRLIFLLQYSFLANWERLKIGLVLLSPILIFLLVNELNFFQTFIDEKGIGDFLSDKSIHQQEALRKYITSEMLLFGTGSLIAALILPFRLILSVWRGRNRGTV